MKIIKSIFIGLILLLLTGLLITGCNDSESQQKGLKIGLIVPLTGELATYGQSAKRGVELAIEEVNSNELLNDGRQIELFLEDSKGETKTAINALQKFMNIENVKLFIGDISSTVTLGMIPVVEQNEAFLFSSCAATPELTNISNYFARNWPSNSQEANSAAEYAFNQMNIEEAVIVYVNNDWGIGLQESFEKHFTNLGGEILDNVIYDYEQRDFRTLVVQLNEINTPLIYLAGNQREMGNFIRQFRETGIETPVIANTSFLEPDALTLAGEYANGVIVPTPAYDPQDTSSTIQAKFYNKFKEQYPDIEPALTDANSYDAIMLIVEAYNEVGNNPLEISEYIRNLKNYSGAAGKVSFTDGDVEVQTVFKKVVDGKPQVIKN
ncbi:MAG: penicillin-binding protein activator [Candidatus Paceibacterota bacterium]